MPDTRALRTIEATGVLLFLLQGLVVLLSRLFGMIYDAVFAATLGPLELALVSGSVLLAFVAPLFAPCRMGRVTLLTGAITASVARVMLTLGYPSLRLWSAIVLVAAAGCYAAELLRRRPAIFATSIVLALILAQLLRVSGNTYDVSLRRWWLPVQGILSLAIAAAAWLAYRRPATDPLPAPDTGIGVMSGLTLGTFLFLETSLLGFPNALARWTGADYVVVAPLLIAATILPLLRAAQWGGFALFAITLAVGWLTGQEFYQLAILAPMLLAQLTFVTSAWSMAQLREGRRTRGPFVLGMILFLVLNVALAFAFTYPYTVALFRDKGDYVFLLAIVSLLLPTPGRRTSTRLLRTGAARRIAWSAGAVALGVTTAFALPRPAPGREARPDTLRVATYNIHYGYDTHWRYSLEEQARTIEESGADIVFLQEVDAGRITSYGVDDALWLGRRLGMEHVFGPALEDLSGVALLSRYPLGETDSQPLVSQLEQTAIVHAQALLGRQDGQPEPDDKDTSIHAYGTWLGLEPDERARQVEDALEIIGDTSPAVLGGDFNAQPGSPTLAALRQSGFADPFVSLKVDPPATSPAIDPVERIDFVLARGLEAVDAHVLGATTSDHRLVVVEFDLP